MAIGLLSYSFMYCNYRYVICTVHVQYLSIYRGNDLAIIIVIFSSRKGDCQVGLIVIVVSWYQDGVFVEEDLRCSGIVHVTGTFGNSIFLRRLLVIADWLHDAAASVVNPIFSQSLP